MDVVLPPFSSIKIATWFAQVEAVFSLNGIISDLEKYNCVVAHIPIDYMSMVEDIVLNPPPESKYDHIKYEFIKRSSIYWLQKEVMGNNKPSEYLQRLLKRADRRVSKEAILNIWLKHLPKPVCEIVSLESSGRIDIISPMADKVMASLAIHRVLPDTDIESLLQRMDKLSEQLEEMRFLLECDGFD